MAGSTLQEWLNRNAYRAYPFVEDTDFTCLGGGALSKSVVLDARFAMFGLSIEDVLLRKASVGEDGSVSLVLDIGGREVRLGPGNGFLSFSDEDEMTFARVAVGLPGDMSELAGEYELVSPARFLGSRSLCVPYGIGVDTLTTGGPRAIGEVRVEDGVNSSLNIRRNNLVLTVRKGLGKGVRCDLPGDDGVFVCDGSVLRFLNGQKADSDGNIQIYGGEGVSVSTGTYKGIPAVIILTSAEINGITGG